MLTKTSKQEKRWWILGQNVSLESCSGILYTNVQKVFFFFSYVQANLAVY